ncbi:MAG: transcriptional regulator [Alphaproteobacteria bacterium RIFOXYD12_FULL_60_8]|nr:MAG: transcriptional regulator [Alphaproteobacteria bacterium RIFOXYD12_FULL_60_8]
MGNSRDFVNLVLELLAPLGEVTARAMFGGHGLYLDGLTFALIADDTLYFKVDDGNRPAFEAVGLEPFRPFPDKPSYVMSYYEAPPDALEDAAELQPWAQGAFAAALRNRKPKKKKAKS